MMAGNTQAATRKRSGQGGQTLQTASLVHEAYLRLTGGLRDQWQDRRICTKVSAD